MLFFFLKKKTKFINIHRDIEEEKEVEFDLQTMSFPGKFEAPMQKRLRETGEWMIDNTEKKFRMSGNFLDVFEMFDIFFFCQSGK